MIRLVFLPAAALPLVLTLAASRTRPVVDLGVLGLILAGVGLAVLWRWPVTAGACVHLTAYAAAAWLHAPAPSVGHAAAFGFSLLLLLESVELGRCLRRASIDARLVRSQVGGLLALAAAGLAATLVGAALARGLVPSIPFALAPFVAAAAALGVAVGVAMLVTVRPRTPRRSP